MGERFNRISNKVSEITGNVTTFAIAVLVILVWAISGPIFKFSETWQLVINTGTTIITFLMVFLIQNTQNRDAKAVHLKLDELIRAIKEADNDLIRAEDETDAELRGLKDEYAKLVEHHTRVKKELLRLGGRDEGASDEDDESDV
jgi:low affinity Fe/Cu permease